MSGHPAVRRGFVDGDYGQIHYRIAAPDTAVRAPLVCLHMSPKSSRSYEDILPWLAGDRVVIAPDYPGHGESAKPPATPHVTVADFARSMWASVDALCDTPVHLLGCHTGALVAVEACIQRPADVRSIVSLSAPLFTADELGTLSAFFEPIPIDEEGQRFSIMWQRVLEHRGPGMTLQMAADSFAENLRAGDDYEWGHRAAFAYAPDYPERLAAIEQPVFVMNPADDCHEASKRADAVMQNGVRKDYPQWGHGFLNAFAEAAAEEILNFIEQCERND
ncbi:MAG: alpha/beta fold hydrolase [Pseudomonadota bacterium]